MSVPWVEAVPQLLLVGACGLLAATIRGLLKDVQNLKVQIAVIKTTIGIEEKEEAE